MTTAAPHLGQGGPELASLVEAVSATRMQATVRELAGDRFAGRRVGSPGGRAAGTWLAERLDVLGARVQVSEFDVAGVRELHATPVLQWTGAGQTHRLEHRRDFVEHLASAELPHPRSAPLVKAPEAGSAGTGLRERWVLAEAANWGRACEPAEAQGAAGVLTVRGADAEGWMPKMIAGPPARAVPVIAVHPDVHRRLAEALDDGPVQVTGSMPLRQITTRGRNVYARFGSRQAVSRVLLCAHYDGVGDDPDRRLPAAADNASGVAAVLEAARVLAAAAPAGALELTVAFLDAEEAGAWGSAHHAPTVPPGTHVINLDGAAHLHQAAAVEAGGPAHALLAALDQAARLTGVPLRAGAMASDNRRYAAAGLAAIGVGMGMPGYQTPAETPDRVQPDTLVAAARLLVATVWLLAPSVTSAP
ncbi:Peptidase family M28 [Nonomuraea coxensis DSM 45129]|uniref:Peptidase family M28 n=1 Tax=Nonomuraea coxensis DSM 45129 TaxID=1122611 RepID=A0ABX8U2I0_9ACTN|nr:M28 family peptidase [Nonomuraea coxensis]QYC41870.1 Peptidase family M28 [Nonomuraea coxensis DSM 45129]